MSSEINNVEGGYKLPEQETPQPVEVPKTYTMSHITFDDVKGILQLVEVALSRGALKGEEMEVVTNIRKDCLAELNNFSQWQQATQQILLKEQAEEEARTRNEILQAQIDKLQELEDRLTSERQRRKQAEIRVSELETRVSIEEPVDDAYVPQSETTVPFTAHQEFLDKEKDFPTTEHDESDDLEALKKVEDEDEPVEEIILDVPEDAKGTEEFFEEVESVANAVDEEDLPVEEVKEEPKSSAPIITGGNAPSLKNVKVLDEPPVVTQEEEFEEIVIPDVKDLNRMTKAKISEAADKFNFDIDVNTTKQGMIDSFVEQSEKLITELSDSEGFISSTTTDKDDNEKDVNRQDGGFY